MKFGKVKIQFELTEKSNEVLQLFMIRNKVETKGEAINKIIELNGVDL